jgi:hypothetical protein
MTHWLQTVATVLQSEVTDLKELAKIAGAEPRHFYMGTCLDGVNICGQDLRGLEFSGLKRAAVVFDNLTKLDPKYWRQLIENPNAVRLLSGGRDLVDQFDVLQPIASKLISEIVREKYAADRTARIFRALLVDRDVGVLLLANYPTGGSVSEERAIATLNYNIHPDADTASFNIGVLRTMEECLRHTFYQNKTSLLLAMIRHLADVPAARPFLISRVKRSYALRRFEDEIAEKLGLPRDLLKEIE